MEIKPLTHRLASIDILRGLVMVIMALDHTRDYFHWNSISLGQDPLDPNTTYPLLYFTRWITHFCAPTFLMLAGTSAFLFGQRTGVTKSVLSKFLLTRGLWLIFIEVTIVRFGWEFNFDYEFTALAVIWAIGICMVCLSLLIFLPLPALFVLGLAIVFGHNFLDNIHSTGNSFGNVLWAFMHEQHVYSLDATHKLMVFYPFVPWLGIMIMGFCLGNVFLPTVKPEKRKRTLLFTGVSMIVLFFIIRYLNIFGDLHKWETESTLSKTFFAFMNVEKYPPSLLYTLATLGCSLIFLALTEKVKNKFSEVLKVYGSVPFFYYVLHIILIHGASVLFFSIMQHDKFAAAEFTDGGHRDFGIGLAGVYVAWMSVVIFLYPLCLWFTKVKARKKGAWWISYV